MAIAIMYCGITILWTNFDFCEVHKFHILLSIFHRFNTKCDSTKYRCSI